MVWFSHLAASEHGWGLNPATNPWLLAGGFVLAGGLIVYLYLAHRRIASRGMVYALTLIRLALLLALLVVLLSPVARFTHRRDLGGSLWLLLDQSGSMAMTDPQASGIERLRWADALGYLPPGLRQNRLDRAVQQLRVLREDLMRLRGAGPNGVGTVAGAARGWNLRLRALADDLAKEPHLKPDHPLVQGLGELAKQLDAALQPPGTAATAEALKAIPFDNARAILSKTIDGLKPLADQADTNLLTTAAGDADLAAAIKKVEQRSRGELAVAALLGRFRGDGQGQVLVRHRVRIAGFADAAQAIARVTATDFDQTVVQVLNSSGEATNLSAGLQLVNEQIGPEEPASVVIVSDGRQNAGGDAAEAARALANRGVRVYGLFVGSQQMVADAAIDSVDAPDWVFKDDALKVSAMVRLDNLAGAKVNLELYRGKELVDTKTLGGPQPSLTQRVELEDRKPGTQGLVEYELRLAEQPNEAETANNRRQFRIAVKQDRLNVLVIEDEARWEYRHLVGYLSRDPRVKLQTYLAHPARIDQIDAPKARRASPTNPQTEAGELPASREEWQAFDLVVLGDVPPETLDAPRQEALASAVKDRGTALVVVAGPNHLPVRYAGQPLAEILPVELASSWQSAALADDLRNGFFPAVAPEGSASVLSEFSADPEQNARHWSAVPAWFWHGEQTQAKPGASVLWTLRNAGPLPATTPAISVAWASSSNVLEQVRRRALLSSISLGMGRVLYLSSDQTWRWRYVNGENLADRFWGQVVRWAVGNDLPAGGNSVRFGAGRTRYTSQQPVTITARLLKEDRSPLSGVRFQAVARRAGDGEVVASAAMEPTPGAPGYYRALFPQLPPGELELSLQGEEIERLMPGNGSSSEKSLPLSILPVTDAERRNLNADREQLNRITQAAGGVTIDGPYADILSAALPQLHQPSQTVEQIGFFADPGNPTTRTTHVVFLLVFIALISAEWLLRKRAGLV